jgi:hypothetical protein
MSKYNNPLYALYHAIAMIPGKIKWKNHNLLTQEDKDELAKMLASGYYVILTGDKSHGSSFIVSLLSWITTGVWAKYSHALMNCDNITDPTDTKSFKFMEANATGSHFSTFDEVFTNCDAVCLLTPVNIDNEEWTAVIDRLLKQGGRPYDDLFDLSDSTHVSCVELVLNALKSADYQQEFADLERMIQKTGNLVPQMYRQCRDFVVKFEK